MARTRATLWSAIWRDEDWTALTKAAQRLYFVLLSQPKLSTAGCLDLMPHRWTGLAADETPQALAADLDELQRHRFIVIDGDELVIRTFVANDLCAGTTNKNLLNGMWSAWEAIDSRRLRKVIVDNAPDAAWDRDGVKPPAEALELRSEPRLELRFETTPDNHGSNHGSDSGSNHRLPESPTATCSPASAHGSANPVALAKHAAMVLARRQIADRVARGEISNPDEIARRKADQDLWPILGDRLTRIAEANPEASPDQVADLADVDPLTGFARGGTYPAADVAAESRPQPQEFTGFAYATEERPATAEEARAALAAARSPKEVTA